ncbi:NADP-dependent oxidoreductase [Dactylosporangium fulvum]|uniref:zinc-binding dehydrogenase n=1 Tax=Dactylosporangium fulvum TaxID=53359 RepID=UPI0031D65793
MTNIEIHPVHSTGGVPGLGDFAVVTAAVPEPGPGQVLIRNRYLALGAVLRTLLAEGTLIARAVGEVAASTDPAFPVGTGVLHRSPWSTYAVADTSALRTADPDDPLSCPGGALTALTGLRAAGLRPGETVYVSGAAGAVGSAAGRVARALGAGRVVGSTGSARKVALLAGDPAAGPAGGFGFDAAFDHRAESIVSGLARLGPVDVVFDTLGRVAELVEAVGPRTRIALCGALTQQLGGAPDPRLDLTAVIGKRLSLHGFTAADHPGLDAQLAELGPFALPHSIIDGLAAAPQALLDLFAGRHAGVVLVRVDAA